MKKEIKQEPIFSKLGLIDSEDGRLPKDNVRRLIPRRPNHLVHSLDRPSVSNGQAITKTVRHALPVHELLTGIPFVYVAPGVYTIGSPEYELGRSPDEVQHEIALTKGFYIQATPVTQRQWTAMMAANPACFAGRSGDHPVESVSWLQCQEFIRKLNAGGRECYRLPTEAEWEAACRAGSQTPLCSGEIAELYCGMDAGLDSVGWYCGNSGRQTHPVGHKEPNAWGLFDMHGNVGEWCSDWYGPYSESAATDPAGTPMGPGRVVRGGSWFSSAKNCRSAARFCLAPNASSDFIGFRLVKDAP